MPTKMPRLNVVMDSELYESISKISKAKKISMSMVAKDLIADALEIHEDVFLAKAADQRVRTLKGRKVDFSRQDLV